MLRAEKFIVRHTGLSVLRSLKMLRGVRRYGGWNLASSHENTTYSLTWFGELGFRFRMSDVEAERYQGLGISLTVGCAKTQLA
jgi:hypothetical protein